MLVVMLVKSLDKRKRALAMLLFMFVDGLAEKVEAMLQAGDRRAQNTEFT